MTATLRSQTLALNDGRELGYCQWGDLQGPAILFLQGWPSSRLSGAILEQTANNQGIRLITVDRPGIGLSTPLPKRRLLDWPDDIDCLLSALGITRLALVGHSAGGAYAMACNLQLKANVTATALISSLAPIYDDSVNSGVTGAATLSTVRRLALKASGHSKTVNDALALAIAKASRWAPDSVLRSLLSSGSRSDAALFQRAEFLEAVKLDIQESVRQGPKGLSLEARLNNSDWGFRPTELKGTVYLYHGLLDPSLPVEMGRYLATLIPNCQATYPPDGGHYWLVDHFEDVLQKVRGMGA